MTFIPIPTPAPIWGGPVDHIGGPMERIREVDGDAVGMQMPFGIPLSRISKRHLIDQHRANTKSKEIIDKMNLLIRNGLDHPF